MLAAGYAGVAATIGSGTRAPAAPPGSLRSRFALLSSPGNNVRTPMTNSGTRKATEPGTHMMTPAASWSARADSPFSRGTWA